MAPSNQQIVIAFEELNLQPEEISTEFGYELAAVKSILMQCSSLYRKACGQETAGECKYNYSDEEAVMARDVIVNTARYADDENLKFKAAVHIISDKKGRLDIVKEMPKIHLSINQFNLDLKKALASKNRGREKVINIPSEVKKVLELA